MKKYLFLITLLTLVEYAFMMPGYNVNMPLLISPTSQTWSQAGYCAFKKGITLFKNNEPFDLTNKERCCLYTGLTATAVGCFGASMGSLIYSSLFPSSVKGAFCCLAGGLEEFSCVGLSIVGVVAGFKDYDEVQIKKHGPDSLIMSQDDL